MFVATSAYGKMVNILTSLMRLQSTCLSCKIVPSSTLQKEFFEEFREERKEADWSHRSEVEKRLTEFKQSVDATNDKVNTTLQSEMNAKVFNYFSNTLNFMPNTTLQIYNEYQTQLRATYI